MTNQQIIDLLFPVRTDANETCRTWTEHERIGAQAMAKAKDGIYRHELERLLRVVTNPDGCYGETITEVTALLARYNGEEERP